MPKRAIEQLRDLVFNDEEDAVSDTDSDNGEKELKSELDEEKTAFKQKLVNSKKQHLKFSEEWSTFLELKGQIEIDNERFKSTEFGEAPDEDDEDVPKEVSPSQVEAEAVEPSADPQGPDQEIVQEQPKEKKDEIQVVNSSTEEQAKKDKKEKDVKKVEPPLPVQKKHVYEAFDL